MLLVCVQTAEKSGSGLTYIPPAKPKLPGHEESYNPPKEYLPTGEGGSQHFQVGGVGVHFWQLKLLLLAAATSRGSTSWPRRDHLGHHVFLATNSFVLRASHILSSTGSTAEPPCSRAPALYRFCFCRGGKSWLGAVAAGGPAFLCAPGVQLPAPCPPV